MNLHHTPRGTRLALSGLGLSAVVGLSLLTPGAAQAADRNGARTASSGDASVRPGGPAVPRSAKGLSAADDEAPPTNAELMERCDGADYCEFHPASENVAQGEWALAGTAENCASDPQKRTISWSRTEGETNSMGISMSATAGVKGIFEATVETTYGHEWSWEETNENSIEQDVSPGKAVSIYIAPDRSTVTGQWELHFGDPYKGHYYWYIDNATVSSPVFQTPWHTRTEEIDANC